MKFTLQSPLILPGWMWSGTGLTRQELALRLVREGLQVEFEDEFVDNGAGHIRMNLACPAPRWTGRWMRWCGPWALPQSPAPPVQPGDTLPDVAVDTPFEAGFPEPSGGRQAHHAGIPALTAAARCANWTCMSWPPVTTPFGRREARPWWCCSPTPKSWPGLGGPAARPYTILCDPEKNCVRAAAVAPPPARWN